MRTRVGDGSVVPVCVIATRVKDTSMCMLGANASSVIKISLSPQNASVCETLKANPFRTGGCPLVKTLLSSSLVKSQCPHHRVGWVGGKNEGVEVNYDHNDAVK